MSVNSVTGAADTRLRTIGPPRRNQFLLGSSYAADPAWRRFDLGRQFCLSVDTHLDVTQVNVDGQSLTLLGFILDWAWPKASNTDILKRIAQSAGRFEDCVKATDDLGGRWVLIYRCGEDLRVFHDAGGLRQVCFAPDNRTGRTWCASQSELLAEAADLSLDPGAVAYIDWQAARDPECWWPGNRMPYQHASALLPNHALCMQAGESERYWAWAGFQRKSIDEARTSLADKLSGILKSAANRSKLALGLSAGWDSRLLLAASREIIDDISVYSVRPWAMAGDHHDVHIPRKLAAQLKFEHVKIDHPERTDPEFDALFYQHTYRPHERFAVSVQAEFNAFQYSRMAVIGNLSEVARLPYRNIKKDLDDPDGGILANYIGMPDSEFALRALEEWIPSSESRQGFKVLDLFYWEQRIGRWLAANCVEYDLGWQDILVPFNIRSLLTDLLACDQVYRDRLKPRLYRKAIGDLWPDVLQQPVNPKPRRGLKARIKNRLKRLLR
ncbi:MAG: hypothetical protein P8M18_06075 [Woeseiaceae bacterium]|nr:hypothetical protein [Woeseiaceae bacterium]